MPRMTITVSDEIHQAHARALVKAARTRGDLNEENALTLAVEETRKK